MAQELKTNTAISLCVGPFFDKTDGITPEVALTVANCKVTLMAETDDNSAPTLILDNVAGNDVTNTLAHIATDDAGYYSLLLTAANLNRLGRMKLAVEDLANHCPVFHELEIVSANYYNNKYGSTLEKVDIDTIKTQAVTCAAGVTIRADVGAASIVPTNTQFEARTLVSAGYASPTNITAGTITTATNLTDKAGFSLSSTGADLILKSSTFIQAIAAAINELATYGLTALNTLLVSTGIKTASTAPPTDMALNSTVAKEATLSATKAQTDKLTFTTANQVDANVQYINDTQLLGNGGVTPWGPV